MLNKKRLVVVIRWNEKAGLRWGASDTAIATETPSTFSSSALHKIVASSGIGQPAWPPYDPSKRAVMLLNTSRTIAYDADAKTRKLWQSLYHI